MRSLLFAVLLSAQNLAAQPSSVSSATVWHLKSSPHFEIYHESEWSPNSIALELERIYGKLRVNLAMFAPWMAKEKTKLYIYRSRDSYLAGEFNPPKWSKGLAFFSRKTVVVFDTGDIVKLRAVTAHELAHLYFESFYGEAMKHPPQWLNEGLAVMMEDISYAKEGPWSQALRYVPGEKLFPLQEFLGMTIDNMYSDEQVGYWYLEAFGVVSYLFQPRTRLQFKNFCGMLRKGEPLEAALWKAYRLTGPAAMETPWRAWLKDYGNREKSGFSGDFHSASFDFQAPKLSSFSFTRFGSTGTRR